MKSITYKKELEAKINKVYDKKEDLVEERIFLDIACDENRHKKYNNDQTIKLLEEAKAIIENYAYLMKEALYTSGSKWMIMCVASILVASIVQSIFWGNIGLTTLAPYCAVASLAVGAVDYFKKTIYIRNVKSKQGKMDIDAELISALYFDNELQHSYESLLGDREAVVQLLKDTDEEIIGYEQALNKLKKVLAEELDPIVEKTVSKENLPPYLKRFTKELEV